MVCGKLIDEADATFVSLQKDVRPADAGVLPMNEACRFSGDIRDSTNTERR